MTDLIKALEAAEGPSRELDLQIAAAVSHNPRFLPRFTASIDAALTLVPKLYGVETGTWPSGLSRAKLYETHEVEVDGGIKEFWHNMKDAVINTTHNSLPIAICIAALSAHQQQEPING